MKRSWTSITCGGRFAKSHTVAIAVLCLFLAAQAAGQQSAAPLVFKSSRELGQRTGKTIASVDGYVRQVERTMNALDRLAASESDLGDRYKRFAKELRALEKAQRSAGSHITQLREVGTRYFANWDRAIVNISDPELREASASRRWGVMESYRSASDRISGIAAGMPALTMRLRDLDLMLAADLRPEGIRRADRAIEQCRVAAQEIIPQITEFREALGQLQADTPR